MRSLIVNILVLLITLLISILFLEFIVFRYFFVATDIPTNYFDKKTNIIKYTPNQRGIFREKNEVSTVFNINKNGWNSNYDKYILEKNNKTRVAVIGDSYVEALMVDYNNSLSEKLERSFDNSHEVYRFSISGAPLSQYLYMLKSEVLGYAPEIVVFVLVFNDFDESWKYTQGRVTSSFMKFKITDGTVTQEIKPKKFEYLWYEFVRSMAIYRYLVYRQKVNITELKVKILNSPKDIKYMANVNISNFESTMKNNKISIDYFLSEVVKLSKKYNFKPLIVIDGDRYSMCDDKETNYKDGIFSLSTYLENKCLKNNILFSNLDLVFRKDYKVNKKKFNYECDGHWNEYGHEIVAKEVKRLINE